MQRGVRAREPLGAGVVLGLLRCAVMTQREWDRLKVTPPRGVSAPAHELAVEAFSHEFDVYNAAREAQAPPGQPRPPKLFASALGHGNLVSLVNDGRAVVLPCTPAAPLPPALHNNAAVVELLVCGWPCLALVTLVPVQMGEEILMDYGACRFGGFIHAPGMQGLTHDCSHDQAMCTGASSKMHTRGCARRCSASTASTAARPAAAAHPASATRAAAVWRSCAPTPWRRRREAAAWQQGPAAAAAACPALTWRRRRYSVPPKLTQTPPPAALAAATAAAVQRGRTPPPAGSCRAATRGC
jgi:hypothetical protein